MMKVRTSPAARRRFAAFAFRAAVVAGCAGLLVGCNTDQQVAASPETPTDYRLRHPITITEADRTVHLFIGSNRGDLTPAQRAEVLAFAQSWRHDATGGILIDLPTGTNNEKSAADAMHTIRSILAASGVPADGVNVRGYRPPDRSLGTIRMTYPRIAAQAGPCGLWPQDIGPSMNREYFENRPPYNAGCATQRNLAAMVANPADLVEPRAETGTPTQRRTLVLDKYRQGLSTATQGNSNDSAKISDVGK
jgi:pilus assembly protein CpaD